MRISFRQSKTFSLSPLMFSKNQLVKVVNKKTLKSFLLSPVNDDLARDLQLGHQECVWHITDNEWKFLQRTVCIETSVTHNSSAQGSIRDLARFGKYPPSSLDLWVAWNHPTWLDPEKHESTKLPDTLSDRGILSYC